MAHAHIEQARAQSAPEVFESALQRGRFLSLAEAVTLAQSMIEEAAGTRERVRGDRWTMSS
jgi:hypothetical protein